MIINRWLLREFFRYFILILALVVCVYLIIDFFEKIDEFIESDLSLARILYFALLQLPYIIVQIMPAGVILAVILMYGFMNRYREILALRASGVSVLVLIRPVITAGIVCSLFLFCVGEIIVPFAQTKSNAIWTQEVKKKDRAEMVLKDIWVKKKQAIVHVNFFDSARNTLEGLTVTEFDGGSTITFRLEAEKGVFKNEQWLLSNGMEQILDKETGRYNYHYFDDAYFDLDFTLDDLQSVIKSTDEMNFWDLMRLIEEIEDDGYDASLYKVDLQGRFSLLVSCFILCLIGAGLAVRCRLNSRLIITVLEGIAIVFIMWLARSLFMSLGYGHVLPPFIAAWLVNVIFGIFAFFLLINAE